LNLLLNFDQLIGPLEPVFRIMKSSSVALPNSIVMNKVNDYYGIDVSKDTLDVAGGENVHLVFTNDLNGFKELLKWSGSDVHFVMETTGVYHQRLAHFLHSKSCKVSVVNALVIHRYSQMLLRSTKTDKADAKMIMSYAITNAADLKLWEPLPAYIQSCKDISGTIYLLLKQRTSLKNRRHSLKAKDASKTKLSRSIEKSIKSLNTEIDVLETMMEELIVEHEGVLFDQLKSIPGIGPKTAMFLIVVTNGFRTFDSSKQVSSFLGMSPSLKMSGSSIRGQSRITKTGNKHMRKLLFLCSFTAYKYNPACKDLYDRITDKGKSEKLALIAVGNKLIKQAFAIAKSGEYFDPEFVSVNPALNVK